jgi:hypothetical protein
MITLFGVPIPIPHAAAGSNDGLVAVLAILLFVFAVVIALVYVNRPVKAGPVVKETPAETYRKAA